MVDEYRLLNDQKFREDWVKEELTSSRNYFLEILGIESTCDCDKNSGNECKHPERYRNRGCICKHEDN